jgi:hypothetical protein
MKQSTIESILAKLYDMYRCQFLYDPVKKEFRTSKLFQVLKKKEDESEPSSDGDYSEFFLARTPETVELGPLMGNPEVYEAWKKHV